MSTNGSIQGFSQEQRSAAAIVIGGRESQTFWFSRGEARIFNGASSELLFRLDGKLGNCATNESIKTMVARTRYETANIISFISTQTMSNVCMFKGFQSENNDHSIFMALRNSYMQQLLIHSEINNEVNDDSYDSCNRWFSTVISSLIQLHAGIYVYTSCLGIYKIGDPGYRCSIKHSSPTIEHL